MTRFETPGQVVLLFTGVAVISVVLIALLNVEAKNRKIKGRRSAVFFCTILRKWLLQSSKYKLQVYGPIFSREMLGLAMK
jgi:hypothetical protein